MSSIEADILLLLHHLEWGVIAEMQATLSEKKRVVVLAKGALVNLMKD
jgi:hypothetical protein